MRFRLTASSDELLERHFSMLLHNGFKMFSDGNVTLTIEIESLEQLIRLQSTVGHGLILFNRRDNMLPTIEIYDDYRE